MCLPNAPRKSCTPAPGNRTCYLRSAKYISERSSDPQRGKRMAVKAVRLFLDYLKDRVTDETLKLLVPGLESREEPALAHGSSTNNLIRRYRKLKEAS